MAWPQVLGAMTNLQQLSFHVEYGNKAPYSDLPDDSLPIPPLGPERYHDTPYDDVEWWGLVHLQQGHMYYRMPHMIGHVGHTTNDETSNIPGLSHLQKLHALQVVRYS
jgi:hypothetical protein